MSASLSLLLSALAAVHAAEPVGRTQTLVSPWVLQRLEERARAAPTADGLHDLSEVWARIGEDEERKALADHVEAVDACINAEVGVQERCDALRPDLGGALEAWSHAEVRSRQLLRDFPDSAHVPDAVLRLAWAWHRQGAHELASAAFTWVGASGTSEEATAHRAWVMVGEAAFAQHDHQEALQAYEQAVLTGGDLHAWALHRQGWTYHRLGEHGRAIDTMKQVVALEAAREGSDPYNMQDQALTDLVRFFADAGELDEWGAAGCGPAGSPALIQRLLDRLAAQYEAQGRFEQAVQARRRAIAEAPGPSAENAARQLAIVRSYAALGRSEEVLREAERLLRQHPEQDAVSEDAVAYAVFDAARGWHEAALADEDAARLEALVEVYAWHLDRFEAYDHEVRFWQASALQSLGRTAEAAAAYARLVEREDNGRYSRVAAERAAALQER